jgi:hypothetical protein
LSRAGKSTESLVLLLALAIRAMVVQRLAEVVIRGVVQK